jgi:hypothetical protein
MTMNLICAGCCEVGCVLEGTLRLKERLKPNRTELTDAITVNLTEDEKAFSYAFEGVTLGFGDKTPLIRFSEDGGTAEIHPLTMRDNVRKTKKRRSFEGVIGGKMGSLRELIFARIIMRVLEFDGDYLSLPSMEVVLFGADDTVFGLRHDGDVYTHDHLFADNMGEDNKFFITGEDEYETCFGSPRYEFSYEELGLEGGIKDSFEYCLCDRGIILSDDNPKALAEFDEKQGVMKFGRIWQNKYTAKISRFSTGPYLHIEVEDEFGETYEFLTGSAVRFSWLKKVFDLIEVEERSLLWSGISRNYPYRIDGWNFSLFSHRTERCSTLEYPRFCVSGRRVCFEKDYGLVDCFARELHVVMDVCLISRRKLAELIDTPRDHLDIIMEFLADTFLDELYGQLLFILSLDDHSQSVELKKKKYLLLRYLKQELTDSVKWHQLKQFFDRLIRDLSLQ